ncbi:hypothetical protein TK78_28350 [Streptomyces sp. Tue 6075]|nr:hypothetical protein TK78_28350 [Streptomyces sp. Tue 6075]
MGWESRLIRRRLSQVGGLRTVPQPALTGTGRANRDASAAAPPRPPGRPGGVRNSLVHRLRSGAVARRAAVAASAPRPRARTGAARPSRRTLRGRGRTPSWRPSGGPRRSCPALPSHLLSWPRTGQARRPAGSYDNCRRRRP